MSPMQILILVFALWVNVAHGVHDHHIKGHHEAPLAEGADAIKSEFDNVFGV